MLDAFIIEELRRREELERSHRERPVMEMPIDDGRESRERRPAQRSDEETDGGQKRGVIVIDF